MPDNQLARAEYKLSDLVRPDKACSDWLLGATTMSRIRLYKGDRVWIGETEYEVVFSGGYQTTRLTKVLNSDSNRDC